MLLIRRRAAERWLTSPGRHFCGLGIRELAIVGDLMIEILLDTAESLGV
jgi:hypothetical protein